ncbi:hypothetical protein K0M31_018668 [Melipona bicolor]|uniref:Uncharacterized protein n=1 Tax=Melipona bicolor TaxID=60889 RepID=A0AA40G3T9_9HYME|nr:hypothetical protein K0M31_018668 [Melipona bicolor]
MARGGMAAPRSGFPLQAKSGMLARHAKGLFDAEQAAYFWPILYTTYMANMGTMRAGLPTGLTIRDKEQKGDEAVAAAAAEAAEAAAASFIKAQKYIFLEEASSQNQKKRHWEGGMDGRNNKKERDIYSVNRRTDRWTDNDSHRSMDKSVYCVNTRGGADPDQPPEHNAPARRETGRRQQLLFTVD